MRDAGSIIIFSLFITGMTGCSSEATNNTNKQEYAAAGERTREMILEDLQLAFGSSPRAARIYFSASCDLNEFGNLLFPVLDVESPVEHGHGLESIREIFRYDSNVVVSEGGSGIFKITIGKVSGRILDTEIPLLTLNQRAQYNPDGLDGAIPAIESTPEFKAASKKLKTSQVAFFYIGGVEPALETLPHLPGAINNVTVDQALDSVAKTFGGVVFYGECMKPNGESLIDIWFYSTK